MKNHYLICGSGRTGSHILLTYFARCGIKSTHIFHEMIQDSRRIDEDQYEREKEFVLHYHGNTYVPKDSENYTVIISYRKDLFDQYCSHKIAGHLKETVYYEKPRKIFALRIDNKRAIHEANFHYQYPYTVLKHIVGIKPWRSVNFISYEEIKDDPTVFFEHFPHLKDRYDETVAAASEKSPYPVKDHILNYDRTKKQFREILFERYGIRF